MPVGGEQAGDPRAGDLACLDVPACRLDEPTPAVRQRLEGLDWDICVVVDDARVVLGLLTRDQLGGDASATAGDVMAEGPLTTRLDTPAPGLRDLMESSETDHLLVTDIFGTLVGAVRRLDLDGHSG